MQKVLIIGGAGYIGSHQVKMMCDLNYEVVVIDNLQTGFKTAVDSRAKFIEGDIRNYQFLKENFVKEKYDSVIHFAALSLVGESVENPLKYFDNNVYGMMTLLQVMVECQVKNLVFSSTAATYGDHEIMPITEEYSTYPTNPYGQSKLMMEQIIKWTAKAHDLNYVALRYFNASGASLDGSIGENHQPETHLIPLVLEVARGKRDQIQVFGDDYLTEDGTCIRDYIHVLDLCSAHVCAIKELEHQKINTEINLGYSHGYSVNEIINAVQKVTKKSIPKIVKARRVGDPAQLIANNQKAREILNWEPQYDNIDLIIKTAYEYYLKVDNNEN